MRTIEELKALEHDIKNQIFELEEYLESIKVEILNLETGA